MFDALEAKFGSMPSSTSIMENNYGELRDALRESVGQSYTDAQQQYITNNVYIHWEKRQEYKRKRKANA